MADDPYDRFGILRPPPPETADAPPEQDVIRRDPSWPNSPDIRGHDELHPVPGAVPANRGRTCPDCLTLLWDRFRIPPEHTAEVCAWNVAWTEAQDDKAGRQPKTGAGSPDLMQQGF